MAAFPAKNDPAFTLPGIMIACLFLSACYSPPFQKTELLPIKDDIEPRRTVAEFADRLPAEFETEKTIVFRFFRNEIAALGYARVNREKKSFEIVCVNHMGVQLFHISGDKDGNHLRQAMPEFKEHEGLADAIGNDIRRVYFDLIPGSPAEPRTHRKSLSFRQRQNGTTIEYVFGGEKKLLLSKRARAGWRTKWEVDFYEYFPVTGNGSSYMFPRGIVLHNRRFRYRLIIRTRAVEL